uniref:Uncharacterized protein n=1 Tax=Vitis vinifera TaxID=29760 RepID=A5BXN4_VITVI|nr:hypothetical protein VITISV_036257 [Vitis vinifera]
MMKGYLNPQICLLLYPIGRGEKKCNPYSMRWRYRDMLRRSPKEEPPKLILNMLPLEMKYAYREEDEAKVVLSSCHPQQMCLGIKFQFQKFGVKFEELVVERSLKLDALNLDWFGVIDGPPLHGHFRKQYL